jgi:hypothetical protein
METTACDVQHDVRMVDGADGLPPLPRSIKEQMPVLAEWLQHLAGQLGRDHVDRMVRASVDLRRAYDRDDYQAVQEVYRRGHGWIDSTEGGFCIGVPADRMKEFAQRHREARRGAY